MTTVYQHQASDLAEKLPRLTNLARNIAGTFLSGRHASCQVGAGNVFREYRLYQAGDSIKAIDWRRSARDDKPMLKLTERLSPHSVWFWLDKAPSMTVSYPGAPFNKFEISLVMMLALADIICRSGDRVGILGLLSPVSRRDIIHHLALRLVNAPETEPLGHRMRPTDELFLFSDGLRWHNQPIDQLPRQVGSVKGRFVHIIHDIEANFPFQSSTNFIDPRTGQRLPSRDVEAWREPYLARQKKLETERKAFCREQGWPLIAMRPEWDIMPVMNALYYCLASSFEQSAHQGWGA